MVYKGLLLAHVGEVGAIFNFVGVLSFLCAGWCDVLSILTRVFLFLVLWNGYSGKGVTTLWILMPQSNKTYKRAINFS
jgi:hypothetical protein